jgi:hypothetical protein
MNTKTRSATLIVIRTFKYVALIFLASISCLDFQFESEYEDINGINLEFVTYYTYGGEKLLFRGDTGYIIQQDSLKAYDFANVDSIYLLDTYIPQYGHRIADFVLENSYAFIVTSTGLRIIDMSGTQPQLAGTLSLQYPEIIEKSGHYLYIAALNNLIIADIAEIENPFQVGGYSLDKWITDLEVDSNFAYILAEDEIQILNVETPDDPNLTYSLLFADTLPDPQTFSKRGNYLYVSARYNVPDTNLLVTYDLSIDHALSRVSQMKCPHLIRYITSSAQNLLALSNSAIFLLNLAYPSRPCVAEVTSPGGTYGIMHNNYIYALDYGFLNIFEIKQIE